MIKKSFGAQLTSTYQTIYKVPSGKKAQWVLMYVTNTSGSTSSFTVRYYNAQADTTFDMFNDYSLGAKEFFKIGGPENEFICMKAGDYIEALDGAGMTLFISVIEENDIIQGG